MVTTKGLISDLSDFNIFATNNLQILPDPNGLAPVDSLLPALMDAAHKKGIKVALHIEPYTGRSVKTLNKDLR